MILLTDGFLTKTSDFVDPMILANAIRKSGTLLVVVGIGKNSMTGELLELAGSKNNFFTVNDFDALASPTFVRDLSAVACDKGEAIFK